MVAVDAHRLDQLGAGDRRRAGAVDHHLDVGKLAAGEVAGVDQARGGDDRGAVLVVVEDRDVHPLAQGLLDDEAVGRGNVLEVDAAEARLEQRDRVDELLRVLGRDLDVDRIDVGEALEQHRLAFHHRLGRERAEIAEAEDRGAVGDDRDEIALGGIIIGAAGILGDRAHRHRDARRISEARSRCVAIGLVAMISIFPGRPRAWNSSASASVYLTLLSDMRRGLSPFRHPRESGGPASTSARSGFPLSRE